jgi:hypothetical protein
MDFCLFQRFCCYFEEKLHKNIRRNPKSRLNRVGKLLNLYF